MNFKRSAQIIPVRLLPWIFWITAGNILISYASTPEAALQTRIDHAEAGAVLELEPGVYRGPVVIEKALTLLGSPGAIIDGGRSGSVISIKADAVRIENLTIRNSGLHLGNDNAGIHVMGDDTVIHGNRIESCLHGIYLRNVKGGRLTGNVILGATGTHLTPAFDALSEGSPDADGPELCAVGQLNENRRGNGIHIWSSSQVVIENNRVARTRDGIYFSFADECLVSGNEVRETRYGLHYMYSDENRFTHNHFTRNAAGAALMYSGNIHAVDNDFSGNRGFRAYGMLLQSIDNSRIESNRIEGNTVGIYAENSQGNRFRKNTWSANYVGLRMGGSSRNNHIYHNRFARNLHTAEVAGGVEENRWSREDGGNRWQGMDSPDLNGDGIGEITHREADFLGALRTKFPLAGLLSGSTGLDMLRFAHSRGRVPGLPAIEDPHPLVGVDSTP